MKGEPTQQLVAIDGMTFVVADIVAYRVDPYERLDAGPVDAAPYTRVWLRQHHGQWNFAIKGDHGETLRKAIEGALPPMTEPLPTEEDREAFQYVLENSDPDADADDPFVRIAKWALARSAHG